MATISAEGLTPSELYANLMDEAKARIETIDFVLNRSGLPKIFAQEIGYLQLRMLCEIISLGCLVAHGDITGIDLKAFKQEYLADRIIKRMTELHAHFYPRPVIVTRSPGAKGTLLKPIEDGFLTRDELPRLYGIAGDYLHRGKLKNLVSRPPYAEADLPRIAAWSNKITLLLNTHQIVSADTRKLWVCILRNRDDNDRVQVTQFE